jgi:hypothetical protein
MTGPFTRVEADDICRLVEERLGVALPIRRMKPAKRPLDPRLADKQKAMDIVLAEIAAAQARCDELEQAVAEEQS